MITFVRLSKNYGQKILFENISFSINRGEKVGLIGPNGAGKTTLFNLITGQLQADGGRIIFNDENLIGMSPHEICRRGISRSFQVVNIFSRLTVFENVRVAVMSYNKSTFNLLSRATDTAVSETADILKSVGLFKKAGRISGSLSHGDQKVLEMAVALGNRPELLILDEPTAGMSPEETSNALELMKLLSRDRGITILFCEHDMELVFSIASRIMVMQHGRTIIQGEPDVVRKDYQVQEAYLGGTDEGI